MQVLIAALLALLVTAPAAAGGSASVPAVRSSAPSRAAVFIAPAVEGPAPDAGAPSPDAASGASRDAYGLVVRTRLPGPLWMYDVAVARFGPGALPDIAVGGVLAEQAVLMFLWNDGTGAFPDSSTFVFAGNVRGLSVRDLDLDGDPDLVVSTQGPTGVLVAVENLGGHAFLQHPIPGPIENAPLRPVIADVTGDGIPDVVTACYDGDSLWLARGLGGFAFAVPVGVPAARFAVQAAASDVDGDGTGDVVVAYEDCNSVSLFRGGAGGLLYADEIGFQWGALGVAFADMAGGAAPDLVVGTTHATFSMLENLGGSFPAWSDAPSVAEPLELIPSDLDGDGLAEVLGAGYASDAVSVLTRGSGGGFESRTWGAGLQPAAVVTGDLDGDGRMDVVTAERWGSFVNVLWGDGGGSLRASREYRAGSRPTQATASDLDGDGRLDVAVVRGQYLPSEMSVLRGRAGGGFESPVAHPTPAYPLAVAAGDLTGDGRPELVTANHGADGISVFVNDGSGGFPTRTDVAVAGRPYDVAIGDLDGDGDGDVVVANYQASTLTVLRGVGDGTLTVWQTLSGFMGPTGVLLADLDADGDLDLAVACYESDNLRLYRNDGAGGLSQVAALPCPGGPWSLAVTSRPAFAYPLLLVACRVASHVAVYHAPFPFSFSSVGDIGVGANPSSVTAADLDGDGLTELVATSAGEGSISIARGTTVTFGAVTTYPASRWPERVMAGDFTDDGVVDLAAVNERAGTVSVYMRRVATTPGVDVPRVDPPAVAVLGSPFPNPVRAATRIPFTLGRPGSVRLTLVDLAGRRVRSLTDGVYPSGPHEVAWDGRGEDGLEAPAGIYFCVLEAGGQRASRRLMVLR